MSIRSPPHFLLQNRNCVSSLFGLSVTIEITGLKNANKFLMSRIYQEVKNGRSLFSLLELLSLPQEL
jgi:hypothetical protein